MRGRKTERAVVSDWMDIERERGISVTSAAVEFDIGTHHLTLLDTPGHKDFSEDTYRTLFAVDGVVMVIDAAKGIESQTRKLFEVCKLRRLPVLTFINKLDQPSRDPFDLLDEIERVLGIHAVPMNWPIGSGDRFRGVFDLQNGTVHLYERKERAHQAPVQVGVGARSAAGGADRRGRVAAPDRRDLARHRRRHRCSITRRTSNSATRRCSSAARCRTSASSRSCRR